MFAKQEVVAMILAGGAGSRLGTLTQNLAKPAVPYGGKYRIIDFALSNCVNSGIEAVGVLTQYQPLVLNEYIGSGQAWDLDIMSAGVRILPPFQRKQKSDWYSGTANAIFQNIDYISRYKPKCVLILSGDHIYKMDYSKMITFHKQNNADCTIATITVPKKESQRFGIINTDEKNIILEFEEKPKNPKSDKASMGIYVFNWEKLKKYLKEDDKDENSEKDFGRNILPNMLSRKEKMLAYDFRGYWKDVGTIESLWEANMDLLDPSVPLNLHDSEWKIYSKDSILPAQYFGKNAYVRNSICAEGCEIYGEVDFSIIFSGVLIEPGVKIKDSIIMPGSYVGKNTNIQYAIVGENAIIEENSKIGEHPAEISRGKKWGISVVGERVKVNKNSYIPPLAMLQSNINDGEVYEN